MTHQHIKVKADTVDPWVFGSFQAPIVIELRGISTGWSCATQVGVQTVQVAGQRDGYRKSLDQHVAAFRNRPLDAGPVHVYVAECLTLKVPELGRTVLVHAVSVGVGGDGQPRSSAWT